MSSTDIATFRTQRVIPFPPPAVLNAFARGDLLAQWWGPDGFTNTFEVFEFRPGGRWKFVMHGPKGTHHPNESVFVEAGADRIVLQHVSNPKYVLTITIAPDGTGSAVTWNQKFENPTVAAGLRPIVEPANEQNLDRLTAVLSGQKL